jgi:hypothetical protein
MPTLEETQAAATALAAASPYVPPQGLQQQPPQPPAQPQGNQPPQGQQPQTQPHPDFAKPPAQAGESRSANIWVKPEEWTAQQSRLQALEEYKAQQDQIAELKEAERLRLLAEKGQVEEAFKQMKAMSDKTLQTIQAERDQIRVSWLNEKRVQAVNEALAGRQFVGKDAEARNRTAAAIRKVLELDLEAIIGPDGAPIVRDRATLEPAVEFLRKRLDSPDWEFNGLLAPNKPSGGSGTDGTRPPATPNTPPPAAMSPEETVKAWQATKQAVPSLGLFPNQRKA